MVSKMEKQIAKNNEKEYSLFEKLRAHAEYSTKSTNTQLDTQSDDKSQL